MGVYFGMPTCALRGGCLTGPNHSGVELHGFLSYLVKCNLEGRQYTVFGYKAKQVRDNIHSHDVARFMWEFAQAPRCGEVYNLAAARPTVAPARGLRKGRSPLRQADELRLHGKNRIGDHICYYSDCGRCRPLPRMGHLALPRQHFRGIVEDWQRR
jgi:CDP-paratose 2-epimerase